MSFLSFRYEDHSNFFSEECFKARVKENIDYLEKVQEGEEKYASFLGWHRVDEWAGEEWLKRYESLAGEIRKECDTLVVIGVGGSNQAARAVYEALGKKDIEIIWAGNTLSAHSVNKLFDDEENRKKLLEVIHEYLYNETLSDHRFVFISTDEYSGAKGAATVAIRDNLEVFVE